PFGDVELPLIKALTGYSEEVASAAVGSLAAFGSGQSVDPLSRLVAGAGSEQLRVAACRAAAAVLKRTAGGASEEAVAVLTEALAGDVQALKEAAAEALSAAGLSADDVLLLLRTEGLGEQ
ncbi:MAG: HEAT repeat domain-containing protein, partial [Candidatus Brocadiae bacterium]|nr:HEAT repeat domain-containing protein [Candidatus Brocadiia bacterium]